MKVSVVQHNPQADLETSLAGLFEQVKLASDDRPDLIALPENYAYMGDGGELLRESGAWFEEICGRTSELASQLGIAIHAGSIPEQRDQSVYNTTVVFDADGSEKARYSKIHLFDADLPNGTSYRESNFIKPGRDVIVYDHHGWKVGCALCFDVRFPTLFRRLRDIGAELIVVPSAFALETGRAHWEVLMRARAIETGTYIAAPAQVFSHGGGRHQCLGKSLVCDPWGQVIAMCSDTLGFVSSTISKTYLQEVRARLPMHKLHQLD